MKTQYAERIIVFVSADVIKRFDLKENEMDKFDKKKFKNGLLFAAAVILIYATVMNFNRIGGFIVAVYSVISPLLLGIVLALILGTPMAKFEQFFNFINRKSKSKKKLPERFITMVSLILSYLLAIAALCFVVGIMIPALVDSITEIIKSIEKLYPKLLGLLERYNFDTKDLKAMVDKIDFDKVISTLTSNAGLIFDTVKNSLNDLISFLANLVTMVIFSIYLLANKKRIRRQTEDIINAYCSEKHAPKAKYLVDLTVKTFTRFFSGQCLEAIILGSIFFVAMTIFGFPYAPVISVVIGVTAFIPYVGAFIGCIVGVMLIMIQSPMRALLFVIMFLIIQQLENNLIYPRVVGGSIGLPAMWTFAALIIGGALYGVIGMLVFIPLASIIYTILKNDVSARLKSKAQKKAQAEAETEETA